MNRRIFLASSAQLAAGSSLLALTRPFLSDNDTAATTPAPATPRRPAPPKPPTLPPDKVQSVVGQAHRSLEKVRQLIEETPLLVNACLDQGGGDFETPLQAAAHTGGREIAEYLLQKGARIDLFAAAMLGQLDFVKASLALDPKAHEIPGPHGFTLLHCARQGGPQAKAVHDWLLASGVPDVVQRPLPFIWPASTPPTTE
jgi:hypothetical protein